MTHDELLAEIGYNAEKTANALRAVVELHKPEVITSSNGRKWLECQCDYEYPCPTIQAIEKVLK